MGNRTNFQKFPVRFLNECCFCHRQGLKPGLVEVEFKQDPRTQQIFHSIALELPLNSNGMCIECEQLTNRTNANGA
jgi:hypothetical protein